MHILRAVDYKQMPWKNGGGVTTEIAVSPANAAVDDFHWRISMAKVGCDGPFSNFPNIDRTLTILDGEGVVLDIEAEAPVRLTPTTPPFAFRGDVATNARLISGPVADLNIMTRRGQWTHEVERRSIARALIPVSDADLTMIFCCEGGVHIPEAKSASLGIHDMLVVEFLRAGRKLP